MALDKHLNIMNFYKAKVEYRAPLMLLHRLCFFVNAVVYIPAVLGGSIITVFHIVIMADKEQSRFAKTL